MKKNLCFFNKILEAFLENNDIMLFGVILMRIGVLTSGGDAPGMNATIRAVVRAGIASGDRVFGIYDGYRGLIEGKIEEFTRKDVSEILNKGGTILGTARLPEFKYEQVREIAVKNLEKEGIEA